MGDGGGGMSGMGDGGEGWWCGGWWGGMCGVGDDGEGCGVVQVEMVGGMLWGGVFPEGWCGGLR